MEQSLRAERAILIYNPMARGLSRHRHLLQTSIESLRARNIRVQPLATEGPGSAGEQARREIERGADLIIAAGGDGTINEVASGMLHSGVPLAILPGGTANVLAREMRIPIHLDRVARMMPDWVKTEISPGLARFQNGSDRVFLCMAGIGLDADIVSRVNPALKVKTGKFAYYVSGFSNFFDPLPQFEMRIGGHTHRAGFGLVSRVRNYGGDLEIACGASLLRDDFEIVLFGGTTRVRYLPYLAAVTLKQVHRVPGCTVSHASKVECSGADSWVQVDGELANRLPASFEVLPQALTMLLPPAYIAREAKYVAA